MSIAWGVEGIEAANNAKIKRLSDRIAALEATIKDLQIQVTDRGNSYEQATQEIAVLQEKGQYFHDFCSEIGIPNGVMPYRVDWLRNKITALEAENERLVGHIDLMADEFKRIQAIHYEKTAHNLEVTGLCERAITNTHQHIPVIKQRDDAEERAVFAKAAGKREAAEEIREWLLSDIVDGPLFGVHSPLDEEYCAKYLTKEV